MNQKQIISNFWDSMSQEERLDFTYNKISTKIPSMYWGLEFTKLDYKDIDNINYKWLIYWLKKSISDIIKEHRDRRINQILI